MRNPSTTASLVSPRASSQGITTTTMFLYFYQHVFINGILITTKNSICPLCLVYLSPGTELLHL
ncbi:hypothetical protein BDZ89DRAFT_1071827 [Hymenopellis radicata]|nr:hypothetical protein BDZ89DRAFT_1071827 [Hymenopellis radicata]